MATVKDVADMAEKLFPAENVCMQDYIGLMEDCISKIDKVVGFVEEKIIKNK